MLTVVSGKGLTDHTKGQMHPTLFGAISKVLRVTTTQVTPLTADSF
jgi:hypothetical protein